MNVFLQFLLLASFFHLFQAFDCDHITVASFCEQLEGCIWVDNTCTGTFSSSCPVTTVPSLCYYIDPLNGSDSQNGSSISPFKTLMPAFQVASELTEGQQAIVTVINYMARVQVEVLAYTDINSFGDINIV